MSRHRFARALALLSAGLLSAGVLVAGVLIGPASPAQAVSLGAVTLSEQTGDVNTTPMFATARTATPCPTGFGETTNLRLGRPGGPYANLARALSAGGWDQNPLEFAADRSLTRAVAGIEPATTVGDGEWWVIVDCYSLTAGRSADQFQTSIFVCGDTWKVGTSCNTATATRTTVAVDPSPVPAGTPVTLTATVCVPGDQDGCTPLPATGTGNVVFSRTEPATAEPPVELGTVALTEGRAVLTAITLPPPEGDITSRTYRITARFVPDAPGHLGSAATSDVAVFVGEAPAPETETTLTVTPASPLPTNADLVLTATVRQRTGPDEPVGRVRFEQRLTGTTVWVVLGTADLADGRYSHTVAPRLADGNYSLQAVFVPADEADFVTSTDTLNGYLVGTPPTGPVATATTLAVSPAGPQREGVELTLTATVDPSAASGTVKFLDGTTELGSATVSGGQASFKTASLTAGTHPLKAIFTPAAANAYGGSQSAVNSYVITAGDPADDDGGDDDGGGGGGDSLPRTGVPLIMVGSVGLLLVVVGGGTMLVTRRRTAPQPVAWPDAR
ncbi:Ig-like domain-containing protein [Micromonospora sp. NBC_01699]|uniref:Ig-like domain-containing protein n=1 Tax=Micromonospora sp. NBC_01699 TaxID=2975984 RepID=UPI002E2D5DA4|nr:Ig-like domain-containing protein [Micromonospora sp. NBC_01699]